MILDSQIIYNKAFTLRQMADNLVNNANIAYNSLSGVKWKGDAGSQFFKQLDIYYYQIKSVTNYIYKTSDLVLQHAAKVNYNNGLQSGS
ncbi:MAG: hypothetical protein LBT99_03500 [Bifidobacteriaceae bacterium]|jgi:hypothetical protein|nr:hypothetical protein [Bifidobacteriaceae bacterium]